MSSFLGFSLEEIKKGQMEYTISEISRQKETLSSVYDSIRLRKDEIRAFFKSFDKDTRIIFTGAGSSGFIGDSLAPIIRKELNFKDVESIHTTDIVQAPEQYLIGDKKTLLISFGRSGNSPESIAAIDIADKIVQDLYHIIITCNPEGKLSTRISDRIMNFVFSELLDEGFAMTSSVTGMMLAAYGIFNIERDLTAEIGYISKYFKEIIDNKYKVIGEIFNSKVNRIVYLGTGNMLGIAREAALKSIELTAGKVMTWYDSPMGFRHGPKSMVNEDTLIVLYVSSNEYSRKYDMDMLKELSHSSKYKLVAISDRYYEDIEGSCDVYLYNSKDKELEEGLLPYTALITAQIIALFASIKLGCTPDNPFPGGEVNRVVEGVTIHKL